MLKKKTLFITLILAAMMIFSQFSMITYADNVQGDTYVLTFKYTSTTATYVLEDGQKVYLKDLRGSLGMPEYVMKSGSYCYPDYSLTETSDTSRIKVVRDGDDSYVYADGNSWTNNSAALTLTYHYRNTTFGYDETKQVGVTSTNSNSAGEIIPPTPKTNLVADGTTDVALVNPGRTTIGEMQYSRSNDNTGAWSTTIPTVSEPGTYDVYYRVVTDAGNTGSSANVVQTGVIKDIVVSSPITASVVVKDVEYGTVPAKYVTAEALGGKLKESDYDITYFYRTVEVDPQDATNTLYGKWIEWDIDEKTPVGTYQVYAEVKDLSGAVVVTTPKVDTDFVHVASFIIAEKILEGTVVVENVAYGTVPAKYIMTAEGKLKESEYDLTYFYRTVEADPEGSNNTIYGKWKEWDVSEKTPAGTYEVYAEGTDKATGTILVVTPSEGDKVASFTIASKTIEGTVVVEDVNYGTIPAKYIMTAYGKLKESDYDLTYFYRTAKNGEEPGKWKVWDVNEKTPKGTYEVYAEGTDKATGTILVVTPSEGDMVASFTISRKKEIGKSDYTVDEPEGKVVFDGEKHSIKVEITNEEISKDATVYYSQIPLTEENYKKEGYTNPLDKHVAPVHAGSYSIYFYIVADEYESVAGSGNVVIDKAVLRVGVEDWEVEYGTRIDYTDTDDFITLQAFKERSYDNELPVVEESIEGLNELQFVMGDGYTDQNSDIGTYEVTVTGLTSDDYVIRYEKAVLTIVQKKVEFSWSHVDGYEFTYDGQEHGIEAYIANDDLVGIDKRSGQVEIVYENNNRFPNSAVDVKRDADWNVDIYTARVRALKGPRAHNYIIDWDSETIESTYSIVPVDVTITPNEVTTIYGDRAVNQGYTVETLVNDEKQEDVIKGRPVYVFQDKDGNEYAPGSFVGEYKIIIDGDACKINQADGLRAKNYQLKAMDGFMDVIKREITMVWSKPATFEYDGKFKTVFVEKVTNNYEEASALDGVTYVDAEEIDAGEYIAVAKLSRDAAWNYEVLENSDHYNWEITKRPATVYANPNTIRYKDEPVDAGFYVDNKVLVNNEQTGKLDSIGDVTFTFNYKQNGKPGSYLITPVVNNLNPNYYIADIVKGKLTVNYRVSSLMAQGKAVNSTAIRITWNGVYGAATYDVYFSKCGAGKVDYAPELVGSTTTKTMTMRRLKKNKCYKYYVVAYNADGEKIGMSKIGHCATGNLTDGRTNVKTIKPTKSSVTINRGATVKVSAKLTKVKKNKKYLDGEHSPLRRYTSDNPTVATVDPSGKVTGVSEGWCRVYIQAPNGMYTSVQVYVK